MTDEHHDILDEVYITPGKTSFRRLVGVFIMLELLALLFSNVLAFYQMESILFSGPVVSALGIILIILSFLYNERLALFLGSYSILLAVIIFLIIVLGDMGPSDAREKILAPWTIINLPAVLIWTVLTVIFYSRKNKSRT